MTQQTVENNNNKNDVNNNFRAAADNFRTAMETGIRFQQDAFKNVSDCFAKGESFEDAKGRVENVAVDAVNVIRKNADQATKCFDEGCKTGIDMLKKSFEAFDVNGKNRDMFAQTRDMWTAAFDAMRSNMENATRLSTQTIENWSSFFNRTTTVADKKNAR